MTTSRAALFASALTFSVAVDQAVKIAMVRVLSEGGPIEVAPFFNLRLGYNTGVSFGFFAEVFRDSPAPLALIKLGIVLAIAVVALRAKLRIETFALSLVAGGAVGNVVDRIRLGAVVDYIDFYYASWHWPTFNLADVFISLGVALFIGTSLLCGKKDPRTA